MKTLIASLLLSLSGLAHANTACGFPPFPPFGMTYMCLCNAQGQNCQWVLVSKR
jgi:hypothetical protein